MLHCPQHCPLTCLTPHPPLYGPTAPYSAPYIGPCCPAIIVQHAALPSQHPSASNHAWASQHPCERSASLSGTPPSCCMVTTRPSPWATTRTTTCTTSTSPRQALSAPRRRTLLEALAQGPHVHRGGWQCKPWRLGGVHTLFMMPHSYCMTCPSLQCLIQPPHQPPPPGPRVLLW